MGGKMNKKLVCILVCTLMIVCVLPVAESINVSNKKIVTNRKNGTFICFVTGDISGLSKDFRYIGFIAIDVEIKGWSSSDGFFDVHLNDEIVKWEKPFIGFLTRSRINGFFFSFFSSLSSLTISGLDSVNEEECFRYTCEGVFTDDTTMKMQGTWMVDSQYAKINKYSGLLRASDIPGIILHNESANISVSYGGLISYKSITINDVRYVIENLDPPKYYWPVKDGSCGEACLWTILHYYGIDVTQKKINEIGGSPGRGLYWIEMITVLDYFGIDYNDLSSEEIYTIEDYEQHLQNNIVNKVKIGHPLLIAVKIYPNSHPQWWTDHFILIVGYTANDELIYNSFTNCGLVKITKLVNTEDGYSLVTPFNRVGCIEFPLT